MLPVITHSTSTVELLYCIALRILLRNLSSLGRKILSYLLNHLTSEFRCLKIFMMLPLIAQHRSPLWAFPPKTWAAPRVRPFLDRQMEPRMSRGRPNGTFRARSCLLADRTRRAG